MAHRQNGETIPEQSPHTGTDLASSGPQPLAGGMCSGPGRVMQTLSRFAALALMGGGELAMKEIF